MNRPPLQKCLLTFLLFFAISATGFSQNRAFNQNSSRSNRSGYADLTGWVISTTPYFSKNLEGAATDSLLFRNNGAGLGMNTDYLFGKFGLGITTGFQQNKSDQTAVNAFIKSISLPPDQLRISNSPQQNMYFLLGPVASFGKTIRVDLHAKGGIFINNAGVLDIRQQGAARSLYRNEASSKSAFPGFLSGAKIVYQTGSAGWSVGFGADYINTSSEVLNYDIRRNSGTEALALQQQVKSLNFGVSIRKIFSAKSSAGNTGINRLDAIARRDPPSGMSTGKRIAGSNQQPGAGNTRILQTGNSNLLNTNEVGVTDPAISCGPVTQKITYADGRMEEISFSCPADALAYQQRVAMQPEPNEVDFSSFFMREGVVHRDIAARNILAGRITRSSQPGYGILTNRNDQPQNVALPTSITAIIYGRETGSGMATGKRIRETGSGRPTGKRSREKGSGIATGRRQYQPLFFDNDPGFQNNQGLGTVKNNPLYSDKDMKGASPLAESGNRSMATGNGLSDGIPGLTVLLVDAVNRTTIATTVSESDGTFYFANIPDGDYMLQLKGSGTTVKGYDISLARTADLAGEMLAAADYFSLELITDTGTVETARALIKTKTKSNQSNDRTTENNGVWSPRSNKILPVSTGDMDGDGRSELVAGNKVSDFGMSRMRGSINNSNGMMFTPLQPGNPINGLLVRAESKQGGAAMESITNAYGEFEITNLKQGEYVLTTEIQYYLNDETYILFGEENKISNRDIKISPSQNSQSLRLTDPQYNTKAQDHNSSRSNKTGSIISPDQETDSSSVTMRGIGPVKWMAPESLQKKKYESKNELTSILHTLDELEIILNSDAQQLRTGVNTGLSNIKNQRMAVYDLLVALDNMEAVERSVSLSAIRQKAEIMNTRFLALRQALAKEGQQFTSISNVLKSRHETAMNSIRNMK